MYVQPWQLSPKHRFDDGATSDIRAASVQVMGLKVLDLATVATTFSRPTHELTRRSQLRSGTAASCGLPFLRPDPHLVTPSRAGAVKAGRRSARVSRSAVSRPCLGRPEHGGTLVVVGHDRPRGARCRGTRDRAATLYPVGRCDPNHDARMRIGGELRGGGPILNGGIEAVDKRGIPPPRTVIASPSRTSGRERSHNL